MHFLIWGLLTLQNRTFSFRPFYLLKSGQKQPKKATNWISSQDPLKTDKTLISRWNPSFLGDVGLIKVVSEFSFGHPKCHFFVPEYGHFCQKCPYLRAQKWYFACPNENSETTFISPTSPKIDGFHLEIKVLSVLSGSWDDINLFAFLGCFWPNFRR